MKLDRNMDNQQPSINYRSIKKNALKYPVNIGEIYGVYEVIEEVKIQKETHIKTRWKCRNINTGQEFIYDGSYLYHLRERVNSKFMEQQQYGLRNYLYRTYKTNAPKRGHNFLLSFEEFNNIISQRCYYCGEEPKEASKELLKARGDTHQPTIKYNGIDRIDPTKDYTLDNCVPCCSVCNYMKHTQQEEDFLNQIAKIYNFRINKGSTTIPKGSTLQANGSGNGEPLTDNAEGEDIVSTL
jgi:hypothetical protein